MKIITEITWNWSPACMEGSVDRMEAYPDEYSEAKISDEKVLKIEEHTPMGEGDKYWCDIHYAEGYVKRIFNPNTVSYTYKENEA